MPDFTAGRALIVRVTHAANLPWIWKPGLAGSAPEHVAELEADVLQHGLTIKVVAKSGWFFQ